MGNINLYQARVGLARSSDAVRFAVGYTRAGNLERPLTRQNHAIDGDADPSEHPVGYGDSRHLERDALAPGWVRAELYRPVECDIWVRGRLSAFVDITPRPECIADETQGKRMVWMAPFARGF